ncbi:hypothetical protein [Arthrobacter sp. GMC3]|uniref:hypothetical protein n=1 Tax=Arthrobacter sp. GMC3 TaxID=2058894 RepID=UPI001CA5D2A0|nr:hypothetical protein [Arthrobacter sp. GMC3]
MKSNIIELRNTRDRKIKQDTRAWAAFTSTNYTTALRQVESQLTQGILGDQVSARHLINTLNDHPLIGAEGGDFILGEDGYYGDTQWSLKGKTDFTELALLVDFLRMFTPITPGEKPEVSSNSLKHAAEDFLGQHYSPASYVSNGRLIWAAAALGLQLAEQESASHYLMIGVSEREHDYVKRMVRAGHTRPQADQHRPAGFTHLQTELEKCAIGETVIGRWVRPAVLAESFPFHEWLILLADRAGEVGQFASDYVAGIRDSDHRVARNPEDLLAILEAVPSSPRTDDVAKSVIAEWNRGSLPTPELPVDRSIRTARITSSNENAPGWGADSGTIEFYEYLCPFGEGKIIEEHDNTPGFREHDHWIRCDKCEAEWKFADGLSVREWRVEPKPVVIREAS